MFFADGATTNSNQVEDERLHPPKYSGKSFDT